MTRVPLRRFAVVGLALAISTVFLRTQLSQALVVRGDDLLYRGHHQRALGMYDRALWFDPENAAAIDRAAFVALTTHRRSTMLHASALTHAYLLRHAAEPVLADDALLLLALRDFADAERDFDRLARVRHDARTYMFAGLAARHRGALGRARRDFQQAVAADPAFLPAARALRTLRR